MRFSPVLVAFLAATATLGMSNTARGEAPDPALVRAASNQSATATDKGSINKPSIGKPAIVKPVGNAAIATPATIVPPATIVTQAKASQAELLSGLSAPSSAKRTKASQRSKSAVSAIAQAGPGQETPSQIQLTPGGSSPAPQPSPEASPTPTPETTPSPGTTPAPEASPAPEATPAPETAPTPSAPTTTPETTAPTEQEPPVLVSEVVVQGVEGDIQQQVYQAIRTQPGRTTTRTQLQEDINAIFGLGYFSNVRAVPTDTPLGVRVTFEVQLNPVLQKVQLEGTTLLPEPVLTDAFSDQYGKVLNLVQLQEGIKKVNKWYQDNGYVLAQVVEAPQVSPDGIVTLQVAEGVVEDIQVRYVDKDGNECKRNDQGKFVLLDPQGNPVLNKEGKPTGCRARTRPYVVKREFELKPGQVFNRTKVERDLQRVFGLGIFDDVKLSLSPGQDPRKVVVVANVVEKNTGSIAAGAGISSASGLFGTVSYQQQNVGGNNQKLGAEVQLGIRETLFDLNFTDPWIGGDPYRTSYTVNLFRRQTISLIFDGGPRDVNLPNGDTPRVVRTGAGVSFSRPLNGNPYTRPEWAASLGFQYQRVRINDGDGRLSPRDEFGNNLSFSGEGKDDLYTVQFGVVRDRRNDLLRPTAGSLLRLGTEQSIPLGKGNILLNRLRASYSFYIPTRLLQFTPACRDPKSRDCPQTFAFNVQGGTVLGDLPPYEAFALGGSNSVRGYDEGDLGSAKTFLQATVEYRFPVFSVISGALFLDAATDFGTGDNVPGNPAGVRGKPGEGFGYGLGLRVQSPLGPIRIDFGINDSGDTQFHFGIGERF
ncbi:MAG: BamA/TamA family outer membrane protein [Stenomitos rutilans HA7619-LM2]|nr:BamA/TamA family outer membrane protein [Stenomitos rutilans HA7619-LM2]